VTAARRAEDLLEAAVVAAHRGGAIALALWPDVRASRGDVRTKSSRTDVVTAADTAAEQAIGQALREAAGPIPILGEESGGESRPADGVRWVVDPIDGTVNYLYGRADFAVAVALEDADGPLVAVVHAPALGHTWTAIRGGGASADGVPLHVRAVDELAMALVATGFGYRADRRAHQGAIVAALLSQVRDIRRAGAAALDLCAVASGTVDGYYERGLQPWDLAAGSLIASEAGAIVGGLRGAPPAEPMTVAAGPGIFAALTTFLEAHGADDGP
jgi:myo-inositol-1(or 4)-monophosphatase